MSFHIQVVKGEHGDKYAPPPWIIWNTEVQTADFRKRNGHVWTSCSVIFHRTCSPLKINMVTWNTIIGVWKMVIFSFHVDFPGCSQFYSQWTCKHHLTKHFWKRIFLTSCPSPSFGWKKSAPNICRQCAYQPDQKLTRLGQRQDLCNFFWGPKKKRFCTRNLERQKP